MEELIVIEGRDYRPRSSAAREALAAYQAAAWRAPGATRFDSRPANDFLASIDPTAPPAQIPRPVERAPFPRWLVVIIGGCVAALLGGLLAGAMSL